MVWKGMSKYKRVWSILEFCCVFLLLVCVIKSNILMKKSIFTFLLLLGYTGMVKAQITPFLAGRLQYTLDSVCNKYRIKGTSAAVLIPGVGIWKGVNGESEAGVPLTSDMLL